MTDMGKICSWNTQLLHQQDCFFETIMRNMLFISQCIHNYDLATPDLFFFGILNTVGICYVSKLTKTKTEDRHFQVPDQKRDDWNIPHSEWLHCDCIQMNFRRSGIFKISK